MDESKTPYLDDLLEDRHREAGHAGSFEGCTLGRCPDLRQEWMGLIPASDPDELETTRFELEETERVLGIAEDQLEAIRKALLE